MRIALLALAIGLVALRFMPLLPPTPWLAAMAAFGLACLGWRRARAPGLVLVGLAWACLHGQWALDDRLAPELDGRTLWLEGRVGSLPDNQGQSVRFELTDIESARYSLPRTVRLSWFNGPAVSRGERWRVAVTLKRPRGVVNPAGMDIEAWMLARGIGASGSVKDGQLLVAAPGSWRDTLRQRLLAVDAQGYQGVLVALVLGDGSAINRDQWAVLQATGTVHLMVISGTHIGLLAGLVYGLVAGLARWGAWPARLPWLPWACGLAFGAALGYGALAGFGVPVQRACIMLGLVLLWRLRFRHLGVGLPWLVALNAVLLVNPLVSLLPGFWLSFAAVAVLMLVFAGRLGAWRWWRGWTRAQWLMAVGLLPVLLALGLPISVSGPLANLLAVPWVSIAVLPAALLGAALLPIPWVGEALLWLVGGLLAWLFEALTWLSLQAPAWVPPRLPLWLGLLVLAGTLLLLLPAGLPMRPLGWPLVLLAAWPPLSTVPHGQAQVTQLDVGQGLAAVVRTRHHTVLYDAGPRTPGQDAGERVVLPNLLAMGVRRLDLMLISHAHQDHAGGAPAVQRGLPVAAVWGGEADQLAPGLQASQCESGRQWHWDGVSFTVWRWAAARDSNPSSCVLLVEAQGERLLLGGDIDAAAERALVASGLDLRGHWLQSPHHGSRTSSSQRLLDAMAPRGALISRGHGNAFGHPHAQVLQRYQANGMEVHDNALHGALHLRLGRFDGVRGERQQRRFWRDPT